MTRTSIYVRRAIKANSSVLLACLSEQPQLPCFKIVHSSELQEREKTIIWNLFEENMFDLFSGSSFGWDPVRRKKELFHVLSRFLLVYDNEEEGEMLAFCMFRFEDEEGERAVYCYDIQITPKYRRTGMGKKLISALSIIGRAFKMEKIVLTVLRANASAIKFYKACSFEVDPASPSRYLDEDDPARDGYDYEIMSKKLTEASPG